MPARLGARQPALTAINNRVCALARHHLRGRSRKVELHAFAVVLAQAESMARMSQLKSWDQRSPRRFRCKNLRSGVRSANEINKLANRSNSCRVGSGAKTCGLAPSRLARHQPIVDNFARPGRVSKNSA